MTIVYITFALLLSSMLGAITVAAERYKNQKGSYDESNAVLLVFLAIALTASIVIIVMSVL